MHIYIYIYTTTYIHTFIYIYIYIYSYDVIYVYNLRIYIYILVVSPIDTTLPMTWAKRTPWATYGTHAPKGLHAPRPCLRPTAPLALVPGQCTPWVVYGMGSAHVMELINQSISNQYAGNKQHNFIPSNVTGYTKIYIYIYTIAALHLEF